jgi:hypothetical protein
MQILCAVNQAECFRRGIDAPRSTIKIDVNPAKLPQDIRGFLADHIYDGHKLSDAIELYSPDMLGLMESVLAAKEYEQFRKVTENPNSPFSISFADWIKGEGKAGSTEREKLAKELTEAQKHSELIPSLREAAESLEANLKKAVRDGVESMTRRK